MKKTIRLTESELQQIIKECVLQYTSNIMCESKLGKIARTTALGLGLTGGMLGGINDANAQYKTTQTKIPTEYQNLQQQIDKDMQAKMDLKKYQDSVKVNNLNSDNEDIEEKFSKLHPDLTYRLYHSIPKGNGSINPNDYKYKIVISTYGRFDKDTIPVTKITSDNWDVVLNNIETKVQKLPEKIIFEHTFENFDIFSNYLPKLLNKLDINDVNNEIAYHIAIDIEGMVVGRLERNDTTIYKDFYSTKLPQTIFRNKVTEKPFHRVFTYISMDNAEVNKIQEKQIKNNIIYTIKSYGDYQNQYRSTVHLGHDMNGNSIYVDKNGNKFYWDETTNEFKPACEFKQFNLDDLNETISHIIKDILY